MHAFTSWFASLNYIQCYGLAVAVFLAVVALPLIIAASLGRDTDDRDR